MTKGKMSITGSRGLIRRLLAVLRSRHFSFIVLGVWMSLLVIWVVPFGLTGQSEATIETIALQWWPFRIVYAVVLISTALCTIDRIGRDMRRARIAATPSRLATGRPLEHLTGIDLTTLHDKLEQAGFVVVSDEGALRAAKNAWSPIGGAVFHGALLLLATGLAVHVATFSTASFRLTESQSVGDFTTAEESGVPGNLFEAVQGLRLEAVEPAFHKDVLLFKQLDAVFVDAANDERRMSLSKPMWTDPFTLVSIQDFGYSPEIEIVAAGGTVVDGSSEAMSLFPPGTEDTFRSSVTGLDVILQVFPDHAVIGGRDVSASYNLREPMILMTVQPSDVSTDIHGRRLLAVGESLGVSLPAGDLTVRIGALREHGLFKVTRSYGLPLMVLGFVLACGGLFVRLLFVRTDIVAWAADDGLDFDAWEDVTGREAGVRRVSRLMAGGSS